MPLRLGLPQAQQAAKPATLDIQLQKTIGKVSPTLYGLMTEEINYSYDGGIYAELVRNRTFHPGWDEPAHWFLMQYGNARASMGLDSSTSASANRHLSLKLNVREADDANRAGVENEGILGHPRPAEHQL